MPSSRHVPVFSALFVGAGHLAGPLYRLALHLVGRDAHIALLALGFFPSANVFLWSLPPAAPFLHAQKWGKDALKEKAFPLFLKKPFLPCARHLN
jgi:hypothetical protein